MENALAISINDESVRGESGEDASLAARVETHGQLAYRVALAVTRNKQDAEDAVQEAFLQLHRGGRWERIEEPRSYLARVAWRLAVRRRKPRMMEQELPLESSAGVISASAS